MTSQLKSGEESKQDLGMSSIDRKYSPVIALTFPCTICPSNSGDDMTSNDQASLPEAVPDYDDGFKDGLERGLKAVVLRLQHAYIDDEGRPDRGSPKGEAMLELARDMSVYAQGVLSGKILLPHEGGKHG
jgi:hypothetical protein